jgi:hypothetical protein
MKIAVTIGDPAGIININPFNNCESKSEPMRAGIWTRSLGR